MALSILVFPLCLVGCSFVSTEDSEQVVMHSRGDLPEASDLPAPAPDELALEYPRAWLVRDIGDLTMGTCVEVLSAGGIECIPHESGKIIRDLALDNVRSGEQTAMVKAVDVEYDAAFEVDVNDILVNLPDWLDGCVYDAVYSYSSTSTCGGLPIPGLTGERVDGYADGKQYDPYLNKDEYALPCSWHTYNMLSQAQETLLQAGYSLLFYDVYRPITGSRFLSDKFQSAYTSSEAARQAVGSWGMGWYVANGVSGHNFGTDVDLAIADARTGEPIPMPSSFDMFGGSGHLCGSPVSASSINEELYLSSVSSNAACLTLHRAMTAAGFSELASEWWHFGDGRGENLMSSYAPNGFDFEAILS